MKISLVSGLLITLLTISAPTLFRFGDVAASIQTEAVEVTATINITEDGFEPAQVKIRAGEAVAWINQTAQPQQIQSGSPHTVYLPLILHQSTGETEMVGLDISSANSFQPVWVSQEISPGATYTYTYSMTGTFPFYLVGQPEKQGRVTVGPAKVVFNNLETLPDWRGFRYTDYQEGYPKPVFQPITANNTITQVTLGIEGVDWIRLAADAFELCPMDGPSLNRPGCPIERRGVYDDVCLGKVTITHTEIVKNDPVYNPCWNWSNAYFHRNEHEDVAWIDTMHQQGGGIGVSTRLKLTPAGLGAANGIEVGGNTWSWVSESSPTENRRNECVILFQLQPASRLMYHRGDTTGWQSIPTPDDFTNWSWEAFQEEVVATVTDGNWHTVKLECRIDANTHHTEYSMLTVDDKKVEFTSLQSPPAVNRYSTSFWTVSLQIDSRKTVPPVYVDLTGVSYYYWLDQSGD